MIRPIQYHVTIHYPGSLPCHLSLSRINVNVLNYYVLSYLYMIQQHDLIDHRSVVFLDAHTQ